MNYVNYHMFFCEFFIDIVSTVINKILVQTWREESRSGSASFLARAFRNSSRPWDTIGYVLILRSRGGATYATLRNAMANAKLFHAHRQKSLPTTCEMPGSSSPPSPPPPPPTCFGDAWRCNTRSFWRTCAWRRGSPRGFFPATFSARSSCVIRP